MKKLKLKKEKIKWVFFDIDNTLFDTHGLAYNARKNAISAMIKAGLPEKHVNSVYKKLLKIIKKFGPNYDKHFDRLLENYKIKKSLQPKIISAGVIAYHKTKASKIKPFPSVKKTLKRLSAMGYGLGIITNGRSVKQWEKLHRLKLEKFFKIVVVSEDIGFEKPDLKIFVEALKIAKCKPKNAVMVGDKEEDFAAGKIGMKVIVIRKIKKFFGIIKKVGEIEK